MSDTKPTRDELLDRALASVREDELPAAAAREITDRVWSRVASAAEARPAEGPLHGCADFQALMPDFVAGTLSPGRALLVGDHTRACVPCRRALLDARGQAPAAVAQPGPRRAALPPALRWAAALAAVVVLGVVGVLVGSNVVADRNLQASVAVVDGGLQLVTDQGSTDLVSGAELRARQRVRTSKGSGAVLALADGSTVEMAERSELALRGSRRGTVIALDRGSVIVHAAPQGSGRLYVRTAECEVAVKGTIFAVNHGLKGSRVSVIEGEVEVSHGSRHALLMPGDQITTDVRLAHVPVADEIAWSRNAEEHLALMRELGALQRDIQRAVRLPSDRTSTRLLDLAPADTRVFAAIPNLTEGVATARKVFEQHLATSPTLRAWWDESMVAKGLDREIEDLLDRLQPLGQAVGDEVVVAVPLAAIHDHGGPVVLAVLDDPGTFATLLAAEIDRINAAHPDCPPLVLVDDPANATAVDGQWLLWIHDDLFAATLGAAPLQRLAATVADPSGNAFLSTRLHARLSEAYAGGVEWLLGLDVGDLVQTAGEPDDLAMLERFGLLDASTLVVEHTSGGERSTTRGVLDFTGSRRGIASWLAAPAPMGSLDFVSPDAALASSVVTRDAADMFDEVLAMLSAADPEAVQELERFERDHNIDLRADIAAALGGEATLAVDVPLLPTPAWKLVVEVYDPTALQRAVEWGVDEANRAAAAAGRPGLVMESSEHGGRTYWTVRSAQANLGASYTLVDGFVVVAQSVAVIEQAIQQRAAGTTLASSSLFRELLPADGHTDGSALIWRNLSGVGDALSGLQTPEGQAAVKALAELSAPSLFMVYAEEDRISFTGSGGDLLGGFLGLPALLGEHGGTAVNEPEPVSS